MFVILIIEKLLLQVVGLLWSVWLGYSLMSQMLAVVIFDIGLLPLIRAPVFGSRSFK